MSIRIRKIGTETVALCAAKTQAQENDLYLTDAVHHALTVKFTVDFESEGKLKDPPVDEITKEIMLAAESEKT